MTGPTVGIVGLGQIGGSLAAAIKAHGVPYRVRAWDRRTAALGMGRERGWVDEAVGSAAEAVAGADLVVLAAPVTAVRRLLAEIAPAVSPGQVVTDVGSTKASIVAEAARVLPAGVEFVGAHPVAGTERSGVEAADPRLFDARPCVLTPLPPTPAEAVERVESLWRALGARVVRMSPEAHDRVFAWVSHLPHLLAYTLTWAVLEKLGDQELNLAGPSLRDWTRVVGSPPALWRDICMENREALGRVLGEFEEELAAVRKRLETGDAEALEALFHGAKEGRSRLWTV
ncbi:prephenate dehydrogenase [Deferrisoma camini]|uniref:prephenate dehydrogenase n=1 Tax=Deferrisoma camini TaxID=1035120 RepID=UPI00046D6756|nr:prephenate dehydrogenase/arogenate dehydrogenase family protein [Deferrisoma camini]